MGRYILLRLAGLAGVLIIVSLITFFLMHLIPGGPYDEEKMPLSEEAKANILRSYGLDKPLWQQYVLYVGNALRFESETDVIHVDPGCIEASHHLVCVFQV